MSALTSVPSPGWRVTEIFSDLAAAGVWACAEPMTSWAKIAPSRLDRCSGAGVAGAMGAVGVWPAWSLALSASASSWSWVLISPISARPSARPAPVGSMPYSDGRTTVTRSAAATPAAIRVERTSWAEDGSSAWVGMSVLYIGVFLRLEGSGRGRDEVARELHADQHEAGAHHGDVGGVGVAEEAVGAAPVAHHDQDRGQRQKLSDLHPDVEGEQVRQ